MERTFNDKLSTCPNCAGQMASGFSYKALGLSWVEAHQLKHFAFTGKDLSEAGWTKFFISKAAFFLSYHCLPGKIYLVYYGKTYSRAEINSLAESINWQSL